MVSTELVIKIIGKTSTYASITSVFANGKPVRMTFLGSVRIGVVDDNDHLKIV